jgi:serine/threonine protein kinase
MWYVNLCVATAGYAYVAADIIHGDIKPQNILVFRDDGGSLLAKVADFGYSCLGTRDNDVVRLPTSWPWVAPEWHQRGFYVQAAKKMDVYSFGMLCFWILFKETLLGYSLDSTKGGGGNAPITFTVPHGYDIEQTKLENLKKEDGLMEIAHELISGTKSLSTEQQITLKTFFDSTLCRDQNAREADVGKLMSLLNLEMFILITLLLKTLGLTFWT